jgi:nucleoside-diphosphate-sugar epimerase
MLLVTGATGFVGRAITAGLAAEGVPVRAAVRSAVADLDVAQAVVPDLSRDADWRVALEGVEVVIHSAARVHVMRDTAMDPLAEYRRVNVDGTVRLAEQAAESGARRLVFLSSVKVNGEATQPGRPFTERDAPAPVDPYGVSKYEAEQCLFSLGRATGMDVVVIRPVLVYGPGVKGNFKSMVHWVARGLPLPLGAVHNLRSLVALGNLVDLVRLCAKHPAAAGEVFLASDGNDLSTTDLLRRTAAMLGRKAFLLPCPAPLLRGAAAAVGKRDMMERLLGWLQVDISKARTVLGWRPRVSVEEGLRAAVAGSPLS